MVHSRRRHGLYSEELAPVHEAIRIRLQQLAEERENLDKAEILFRVLFRFDHHHGKQNIGRCKYPQEINWGLIENYINGPLLTSEDILEIVAGESKRKMMDKETTIHVRAVSRDDVAETSITTDKEDPST